MTLGIGISVGAWSTLGTSGVNAADDGPSALVIADTAFLAVFDAVVGFAADVILAGFAVRVLIFRWVEDVFDVVLVAMFLVFLELLPDQTLT